MGQSGKVPFEVDINQLGNIFGGRRAALSLRKSRSFISHFFRHHNYKPLRRVAGSLAGVWWRFGELGVSGLEQECACGIYSFKQESLSFHIQWGLLEGVSRALHMLSVNVT